MTLSSFGVIEETGDIDDRVRLVLGSDDVHIAESYEVRIGVFNQPTSFSLRLGNADTAAKIIQRYPPKSPFQLYIGDVRQQTGELDGPSSKGTGGTNVTVKGRDMLARLHDDHISDERSFKDATYIGLAQKQLEAVGLGDIPIAGTNRANRQIRAGIRLVELAPGRTVDQILTEAGSSAGGTGETTIIHQEILARLNERRYEFLLRHLQLAGLFFWAAADGTFVLSEPNANQRPMGAIIRRLGQSRLETNIIDHDWQNDTTHRFTEYSVYGHGGGKKGGHAKALGVFVDDEMFSWGFQKKKVWHAQNARTQAQGEFLARRMAAEDRRNGWQLKYTMSGHTTASLGGGERAVWTPDTVVRVIDEILGIDAEMYVAECLYRRNPQTTTDITLLRIPDLVFGPGEFPEGTTTVAGPAFKPGRTVEQIIAGKRIK